MYALEPVIEYVGANMRLAGYHFESIKGQLETNEALRWVYGNLVPDPANLGRKWTNTHFETTNGVNVIAQGRGKGRGINIRDQRPTKVILDDIEDDEAVRNPDMRAALVQWIDGVIMPSKDNTRGFVKMIGTVLHPEAALLSFYAKNGGMKRAAIEDGESTWPTVWPLDRLDAVRTRIGSMLFDQEYMNIPIASSSRLIKESWIKRVPRPQLERATEAGSVRIADTYGAIDPAISETTTADYTASGAAARSHETGIITFLDVERGHYDFPDQIALVFRKHRTFKFVEYGVETVAYQKALKQEIDRQGRMAEPPIYVPTIELTRDKDKVRRAQAVIPFIENGTIVFADDLPEEFFAELLQFPNGAHDDMVDVFIDSCTLAIQGATDSVGLIQL